MSSHFTKASRHLAVAILCVFALVASTPSVADAAQASHPVPAAAAPPQLSTNSLLAPIRSWDAIRSDAQSNTQFVSLRERVVSKARGIVNQAPLSYSTSNPGSLYNISQTVLDRSSTLSIAWALTGDTSFAERAWQELEAVARYGDWNPAHFLDTASLLQATGIGVDTFRGVWSAERIATLERAILEKGLNPARSAYDSAAEWTTTIGNWNVVSNAGVGMGALALRGSQPAVSRELLDRAVASLANGLRGFSEQGGYHEGPQYWSYAIQHLVTFAQALRATTGSDRGIFASPGLSETASMAWQAASPTGTPFNYSDSKLVSFATPALFILGREYSNPVATKTARDALATGDINQWSMVWFDPTAPVSTPAAHGEPLDRKYGASEMASLRANWSDPWGTYVSVKSASGKGNNHPELDAGTFVMSALGVDWAIDLGPDNYALPGYENGLPTGERWTYYRKRAEGNNTLTATTRSTLDQNPGVTTPISVTSSTDTAIATTDLSAASEIFTSWRRGVMLFGERRAVRVQDDFSSTASRDVTWSMHTRAGIEIAADGRTATLTQDGQKLEARIASPGAAKFTWAPAKPLWQSPAPAGQASNHDVRKLMVELPGVTSGTLTVDLVPVREGQAVSIPPVSGVSTWVVARNETASLSGLAVDGKPLAGFAPNALSYTVPVVPGARTPTITATAAGGGSARVTQSENGPGEATVVVTAPNRRAVVYRIHFSRAPLRVINATSSTTWAAAQATTDGDMSTKWVGGGNHWLQYDFREPATIYAVRVRWAATAPSSTKFGIVTQDGAGRWVTRYSSGLPTDNSWQTYRFDPVTSRYAGIVIDNQNVATRYTGIHEIEFLGYAPAQPPSNTLPTLTLTGVPREPRVGDSGNLGINPFTGADASRFTVRYVSADPSIIEVTTTGAYTARAAGTTRVGVIATAADGTKTWDTVSIAVSNPWVSNLPAIADTYVNNAPGASTTNYGTSAALFVKRHDLYTNVNREAYARFDLSSVAGKTITSAVLEFEANTTDADGSVTRLDARAIAGPWNESTVTYATKPALGSILGSVDVTKDVAKYSIDVTAYVQQQAGARASADIAFDQSPPKGAGGLLVLVYGKDTPRPPVLRVTTAYQP